MDKICVGKFVNTHGLKGEIRIISDFEYKNNVFKPDNKIYINDQLFIIDSYRKHKNYDMVTFKSIFNINQIEKFKGSLVYIKKDDYNFKMFLNDLIGMDVYSDDKYIGKVIQIVKNPLYSILKIKNKKEFLIPYIENFVKNVDLDKRIIVINYMKGLFDEN